MRSPTAQWNIPDVDTSRSVQSWEHVADFLAEYGEVAGVACFVLAVFAMFWKGSVKVTLILAVMGAVFVFAPEFLGGGA